MARAETGGTRAEPGGNDLAPFETVDSVNLIGDGGRARGNPRRRNLGVLA